MLGIIFNAKKKKKQLPGKKRDTIELASISRFMNEIISYERV